MTEPKRRIAVFTSTRAEYGLLFGLMKAIQAHERLELQVIVSGMHLSPEFGGTLRDIEADGFPISAKVEMLLSSDTPVGVAKSMGLGTIGYADALDRLRPGLLVVLGDRFEALAIAQTALVMRIPIAHIHGGEITEGAYDDAIRHAMTKMSHLHFTATEPYRQRVIQMGESPDRVFNVGAPGLDHLLQGTPMSTDELAASLNFELRAPWLLVTYHPVTLAADEPPEPTFQSLLAALDQFPDHQVLLTYPNADNGGRAIIPQLEGYANQRPGRVLAIPSLGLRRYHSALAGASAMIGNSSSGIIEAPAFGVPTVNVGQRQQGRLSADSVIHCGSSPTEIQSAIARALTPEFKDHCQTVTNPYGAGHAAERTVAIIAEYKPEPIKRFHDLH